MPYSSQTAELPVLGPWTLVLTAIFSGAFTPRKYNNIDNVFSVLISYYYVLLNLLLGSAGNVACLSQELKNAEMAIRTKETPPGLQYENTAPSEYVQSFCTDCISLADVTVNCARTIQNYLEISIVSAG